ncbi:ATP-dependent protease La [Sistotremastrum suecicum HHB10207 ss-3]|uniref:Lon protease homolog n=1 Tax=Sistotremastrum suecicum HHB10207 ss-3 TaxID=1314776 RepID=A0A166C658_9AGAM|nr:ATP-dependent protease La [Sistotremastrum suecicum HHB10207 ss-3]
MSLMAASSPSLPIVVLPYPLILLPSAKVSIPVTKEQARFIISLLQDNQDASSQTVLGAVPILKPPTDDPKALFQLNRWGCAARVTRLVRPSALQPSQPFLVSLQGLSRFQLVEPLLVSHEDISGPIQYMNIEYPLNEMKQTPTKETVIEFKQAALRVLERLSRDAGSNASRKDGWRRLADLVENIDNGSTAASLADVLVAVINGEHADRIDYLSSPTPEERIVKATILFTKQATISEVSKKIESAVSESLSKQQKEYFLRQQLSAIQKELSSLHRSDGAKGVTSELDDDEQSDQDDMADLKKKIEAMREGSEERKMGTREWRRLKRIPQGSVENGVIRSYLEWLTSIPWPSSSLPLESIEAMKTRAYLINARAQLDSDHFGLEKIKRRLIEYLAVVRLKYLGAAAAAQSTSSTNEPSSSNPPRIINKAPILLFVGPPGVGKTSLGQSVAKALNRPFQRISLGGVRDEAEIRGHRRTYVASGPGAIVQALRKAGRPDPVLLLDEIDKVGHGSNHGDPAAALLEVLDPEQNHSFNDHYINVPIDLSQVLFICTSNTLDTISAPLLDRCEVIQLSGYTFTEKLHIAKRFLMPKQLSANGLREDQVILTDEAMEWVATRYTREAGVRSLERAIGGVVRAKAVEWAEFTDNASDNATTSQSTEGQGVKLLSDLTVTPTPNNWNPVVRKEDLEGILGIARYDGEERDREEKRGVVWGLVVMGMGEGAIMPVETIAVPGSGNLKLTGSLGDVIRESAELALSWVKTHAYVLHVTNAPGQDPLKTPDPIDVHLHLPAGAQKKDGPSAGIAMVCAFTSLLTGATVPTNIAMTGEVTLRGRVTPVGGIKEKVLGAHRARATKLILPYANQKDVELDVPKEVKAEMEFVFVKTIEEGLKAAFGRQLHWRKPGRVVESRL